MACCCGAKHHCDRVELVPSSLRPLYGHFAAGNAMEKRAARDRCGGVRPLTGALVMAELSRDEVVEVLGSVGDVIVAEIIATGIGKDELVRAHDRVVKDR